MPVTRHPLLNANHPVGSVALDENAIRRLTACLDILKARGDEIAQEFYGRLFTRYPAVRALFPTDMASQKKKLIESLVFVVEHARNPSQTLEAVREMGRRHAKYGAKPEHYPIVCGLLIEVMALFAGELWTTEVKQEWAVTLELISRTMIAAYEQPPQSDAPTQKTRQ